jgi:F-type H+-transporting ATPase subunit delta
MSNHRAAYAYAKSLMELAIERGELEEVHQDFILLADLSKSNRDLELALRNPIITSDKKLKVLNALFASRGVNRTTLAFFEIICRKNRADVLSDIAKQFRVQYNLHKGIQVAEVTTASAITEGQRAEFISIVKEISSMSNVQLVEKINTELIGGFILRVNDRQLDESLSTKLRILKTQFVQDHYESKLFN